MNALIKLFLIPVFFAISMTIFANTTNVNNNRLVHTSFVNQKNKETSNPINLYSAGLFLAVVLCAYRFRKKII